MSIQQSLLGLLADGALHSGRDLANSLGVTRAAVWKHVRQLENFGLNIGASAGKGYQLAAPLELLDRTVIEAGLNAETKARLGSLEVLWSTASTSDYLLEVPLAESRLPRVCLAEFQAEGRGRRGRPWLAPAGHGLCMSLAWCFDTSPANLSCLGLAVGIGTLRALRACGAVDAELKWPNDVVVRGRKLAGVLIDVQGETGGPMLAVAGIGVNYQLNESMAETIMAAGGLSPVSMTECAGREAKGRNRIAAALVNEVYSALEQFERDGFAEFAEEWRSADYLCGREISVEGDQLQINGIAQGIADDGRLCVKSGTNLHYVATGDVSVRSPG